MPDSDTPVLDLLASMTADSLEASSLDSDELMLVRLAALVAADAPPASYVLNLCAASELGFELEDVQGVLAAIAPIVGTARIATATGNIVRALGFGYPLLCGCFGIRLLCCFLYESHVNLHPWRKTVLRR